MPLIVYECPQCGLTREFLLPAEEIENQCMRCGDRMYRAKYLEKVQIKGDTTTGAKLK